MTHLQIFWNPGLESEQARFRDHRLEKPLPGYITGTLLAKRAIFQKVGPFNPALRYGDAMDWFLRAAERGAVQELMPDVLLLHRMHETNLSRREASASRNEFLHILKANLVRRRSFAKATAVSSEADDGRIDRTLASKKG